MKICICRDFGDAAVCEALENNDPERAEELHEIIAGQEPKCGQCLVDVDAILTRHKKGETKVKSKDITEEERQAAETRLTQRFAAENDNQKPLPRYKRAHINRAHNKPRKEPRNPS